MSNYSTSLSLEKGSCPISAVGRHCPIHAFSRYYKHSNWVHFFRQIGVINCHLAMAHKELLQKAQKQRRRFILSAIKGLPDFKFFMLDICI